MKRQLLMIAFTVAALTAGASLASATAKVRQEGAEAQKQEKLAKQAKVTKEEAQATALRRAPGTVESAELEREHRKLVWSFDIRNSKGTIDEVQVSAITGKVVRVEHENKKQEDDEKRKEKSEHESGRP